MAESGNGWRQQEEEEEEEEEEVDNTVHFDSNVKAVIRV